MYDCFIVSTTCGAKGTDYISAGYSGSRHLSERHPVKGRTSPP